MLATALRVSGPVVPRSLVTTSDGFSIIRVMIPRWNMTEINDEKKMTTGRTYKYQSFHKFRFIEKVLRISSREHTLKANALRSPKMNCEPARLFSRNSAIRSPRNWKAMKPGRVCSVSTAKTS